jgi:hypothetical protein
MSQFCCPKLQQHPFLQTKVQQHIKRLIMPSDFLSSMTFASGNDRSIGCDCDECGVALPAPIAAAVRKRKRERLETGPLRRTQDRSLINREDGIAVWRTIMPIDAEPLLEFGQSHRIVWINRLDDDSCQLRSIGQGIIGSSDEEKSRKNLDWEEGDMYFVESNGGKAVGWTHNTKTDVDKDSSAASTGHAMLQIVKIPLSRMTETLESHPSSDVSDRWSAVFLRLCKEALINQKRGEGNQTAAYKFQSKDCAILKQAFENAELKEKDPGDSKTAKPSVPVVVERL